MSVGLSLADLIWLAGALMVAGAVTGVLAGVFGVGGGAILVPVLYELFQLVGVPLEARMPLCVGTSLAIIIPTSIRSYRAHRARGAVDASVLRQWAIPVVAGVALGSLIARVAPEFLFKLVFVVVAGVSAVRLLFGRESWRIAEDFPRGPLMKLYGLAIGVLSTLMGIGGGQLSNLLMTFYGRPIHQAVATSSGLGVLISIPGALGYIYAGWPKAAELPQVVALQFPFALGYVSLIGALVVMPASMLTAPLGVKLAHALSKRRLEVAFGLFLVLVCARFAVSLAAGALR
ncbi:MAG: sulfite exporter TauE/SafE family protein [Xanthobacteraceae bacterium]|nr:MAG: sulfite exporter TauE/SafE family protein [Xanthobacteraceae bacterium]